MENINKEVMALLDKYGSNTKQALRENGKLEYVYALSELRENLLEWYDFKEGASLLQVGADYGALTGLFCRNVNEVTVLDEDEENLDVLKVRYSGTSHIQYIQGTLMDVKSEKGYDYITIIGSLKEPYDLQLEAAKRLLCPGGTLIIAVCNPLGMKYWAGAEKDRYSMTKNQLDHMLPGGLYYYPMPDYRIPSTIYSEKYLPKKGDLTKTLALYDYPKYLLLDVGATYDMVCEDDQFENFANSFLVMWEKGE
ncbi:MAG: class I SAM-dependent methyltransferase [Clostridium sp.]